jgi:hypothetical protein
LLRRAEVEIGRQVLATSGECCSSSDDGAATGSIASVNCRQSGVSADESCEAEKVTRQKKPGTAPTVRNIIARIVVGRNYRLNSDSGGNKTKRSGKRSFGEQYN